MCQGKAVLLCSNWRKALFGSRVTESGRNKIFAVQKSLFVKKNLTPKTQCPKGLTMDQCSF